MVVLHGVNMVKKKLDVKPQIVKNQLRIFVNAYKIVNPMFDGQTKETLKTPKAKFGSTIDITEKFIIALSKTDIYDKIQQQSAYKNSQLLSKTDGKKSKKVKVNKLSDANKAGTTESKNCTIIFTEGDSAKTMAISGLAEVGRDYYGVFPLRGKILNVRDAATAQIMNCIVLNDIKQIIGLQNNIDYKKQYEKTGVWPLRYGKVMIMTDQDSDGSHIKGLMMNMFDSMWKSLLDIGFISSPTIIDLDNDNDVEKVEKEKKKTLPPHILKAAKALLPKIQSLAKNKSEQRIKKILAILLDMEESQITLVCENDKVLAKRVKEAEEILNDDHWTKRVRKVTLGE